MDLLQRTTDLIKATKMTYREIADGAGVDIQWFAKFKQGRIGDPGVSKVQAVHDFLAYGKRAAPESSDVSSRDHAA